MRSCGEPVAFAGNALRFSVPVIGFPLEIKSHALGLLAEMELTLTKRIVLALRQFRLGQPVDEFT